ncbi:Polygalacturonase [Heracleum sosnowskyi]|uniref:Polygalacturonase n=1 Tax=Heracleum sosnowskyi TaxID=360622 RepID=A0AAD8IGX5_9APIA|nr:Polygalacturonase [Heracleum sosnowskyi]
MGTTLAMVIVALALLFLGEHSLAIRSGSLCKTTSSGGERPHTVTITEFGAVGDGVTLNTIAFINAMYYLTSFEDKGGAKLFIPAGKWLTGSFILVSHITLWLDKDAVILGSTISDDWPVIEPLPSYGRGRELPGGRHRSLIIGYNVTDVVITGDNGTIDGQGSVWWNWFHGGTLNYTRPHMVELIDSKDVLISNLTFLNSPFWNIHPVYCSQVVIQNVTIIAPLDSPNTDGIDPDSSNNVCIEDCYIRTGDDLVAIKSGWDQYGISFAHPSTNITIHRLIGETNVSAGIAIGSEMSGGVSEVYAEDIQIFNSKRGIAVKTSPGRGGYVKAVYISGVILKNVQIAIEFNGQYGEHPDETYDPHALPRILKVTIHNVTGDNVTVAGHLEGIKGDDFLNICLSDINLRVTSRSPWTCSYVGGFSDFVSPDTCRPLKRKIYPESHCYNLSSNLQSVAIPNRITRWRSW